VTSTERELQRVVRSVVQALADAVADTENRAHVEVPDLGPRVVMDQLRVMVFDAVRCGLDASSTLGNLRRTLA